MAPQRCVQLFVAFSKLLGAAPVLDIASGAEPSAEERAVAFLAREVPQWPVENKCFSCHNNADGARALFAAKKLGYRVTDDSLKQTAAWLVAPDRWEQNGGKAEFTDKRLATVQFGVALAEGIEFDGLQFAQRELNTAQMSGARKVAAEQGQDGGWHIETGGAVGSPVTYGPALATAVSLKVLRLASAEEFAAQIESGEGWLAAQRPKAMPDAAAVLLGLRHSRHARAAESISAALEVLAKGQDKSGGWGPYASSSPEPFDTALAVLALCRVADRAGLRDRLARGRKFLLDAQLKDGSWVETTRPAGAESYAQRISTTAWATQALLATREKPAK